jgi:class 3 adenylate cyclase
MSAYLAHNFWALSRNLEIQLRQVRQLSLKSREQEAEKQRMLHDRQKELEHEVALRTREVLRQKEEIEQQHIALKSEKKKTDDLLRNILPDEVAEELKQHGTSAARLYERVTVLFTDFADFTQLSERLSPEALVAEVDQCFKAFDGIIEKFGLEKIKTVGDAYIAVAGLPVSNARHAQVVVDAALAIRDFMDERRRSHPFAFHIRLGVHSGPVVAGIVGLKKFAYDIWGDTVNTAARMEQHGEVGKVNVSFATYELLQHEFSFTYRGELEAKHKGKMGMYFAERIGVGAEM